MVLILIELVPVMVKLFSPIGSYDARLNQREQVAKENARLGKESEIAAAAIKAESSIAEARQQSEIHKRELELGLDAANAIASHRFARLTVSEKAMIDTLFDLTDEPRKASLRNHVATWKSEGRNGNGQPFNDFMRQEIRNRGVDLTA